MPWFRSRPGLFVERRSKGGWPTWRWTDSLSRWFRPAHTVRRTDSLIALADEDYLLVNIQLVGQARVCQGGRTASLSPGAMTFLDSSRPYELNLEGAFSQLIVRVPRSTVSRRALLEATAVTLGPAGPGRVVADFLIGMQRLDAEADALVPHAIGLLESALGWASGAGPTNGALTRERVHGFIRRHATDPRLDSESVAAGCGVSRRTLYRALAEAGEPLSALIRRLRVIHARRQSRKWHRSSARLTQIVAMSPYPDGCAAYPC